MSWAIVLYFWSPKGKSEPFNRIFVLKSNFIISEKKLEFFKINVFQKFEDIKKMIFKNPKNIAKKFQKI